MRTPEILNDRDAEDQAAKSRRDGCSIVRDHLSNHLQHNGGRSSDYVSWIATLHPENAEVTIDQRFFVPGNPWWTIYEEKANGEIPSAMAVPLVKEEEEKENDADEGGGLIATAPNDNSSDPAAVNVAGSQGQKMPSFLLRCSPIDFFVSTVFLFNSVIVVLALELVALLLYLVAAFFYCFADCLSPPNILTGIFYSIGMLLYYIFFLCDSILLLTSVLIAETLALVGWIVSVLFGGIWNANWRHQYVRRLCHKIRSVFRSRFTHPPRHFALCGRSITPGEGAEEVDVAVALVGREDSKAMN